MKLPKIDINNPQTLRAILIVGLIVVFILILITSALIRPEPITKPVDKDQLSITENYDGEGTTYIEVFDHTLTEEDIRKELDIPEDQEIIIHVPGASSPRGYQQENPEDPNLDENDPTLYD